MSPPTIRRERARGLMKEMLWLLAAYLLVVGAAFAFQRKLMYFPDTARVAPRAVGLAGVEELVLETADGERLIAWFAPARKGRATFLYFHGNGGNVSYRADRIRAFMQRGNGIFMLSYRGYGGSTGSPSERALVADGRLAYDALVARGVPPQQIVLYGESLGAGIAVPVAAEREVAALVLEAPFTSAVDVAARAYWFLPVRALMWDRFEIVELIGKVDAPVLVLHGERDSVVPARLGRALYEAASEPRALALYPQAGHEDLYAHGAWQRIATFLSEHLPGEQR